MTATTQWRDGNPAVVIHEFVGKWSTAEFEDEIFAATPEIESHQGKVVVILDVLQYSLPPREVNILAMLRRFNQKRPANIELTVIVSGETLATVLLNVARRVIPKSDIIYTAKSLDDALALVAKHTKVP